VRRSIAAARGTTRALVALVVLGGCLAAVAYAAKGPAAGGSAEAAPQGEVRGDGSGTGGPRPPRPLITRHPARVSTSSTASFAFKAARGAGRFQCRLDGAGWRACRAPVVLRRLAAGTHRFSVRALNRLGRRGAAARFGWRLLEPKPFSIEPRLSTLGALYPGASPQALPVVLENPNPVPIRVTGLRVAAGADPPGCESGANLALIPSSASPSTPLVVPAGGAVSLPRGSVAAPAIALRELPVSQDACQGARFPLTFSGEAHG
jgi:hypothetical protein